MGMAGQPAPSRGPGIARRRAAEGPDHGSMSLVRHAGQLASENK